MKKKKQKKINRENEKTERLMNIPAEKQISEILLIP